MSWAIGTATVIVLYAYVGFPLHLWLRSVLFPRPWREGEKVPHVSVVIAAYNEERSIAERIDNLLASDFPADHLEIIIGSDGSSDSTHEIVKRYAEFGVRLEEMPRQGKGPTLNAAVIQATGELLIFSDANTEFASDTLRRLVRPFTDPEVGGVAGSQVYRRGTEGSSTADGERWYWNYDQWLKSLQSRGGSVTSATGAIYAIRRDLYEPVPSGAMDDFFISTGVIRHGYRLVYMSSARAFEPVAEQEGVEFSRKWRVIMQGLHAVACRRDLLNPLQYGFYSWQLFTHKILRRLVGLPVLMLMVALPCYWNSGIVFQVATVVEAMMVLLAVAAWMRPKARFAQSKPIVLLVYFAMVNAAAFAAIWSLIWGRKVYHWEPERHQLGTGASNQAGKST